MASTQTGVHYHICDSGGWIAKLGIGTWLSKVDIKVAINHLRAPPLCEAIQIHDTIDMHFNAHRTQLIMTFV